MKKLQYAIIEEKKDLKSEKDKRNGCNQEK
jgi:hypothetical protein